MSSNHRPLAERFPFEPYFHKRDFDFDFGDLPDYVIRETIIGFFTKRLIHNYEEWRSGWLKAISNIPKEQMIPAMKTGIAFGQALLDYHNANECKEQATCSYNEHWLRRINMATDIVETVEKETPSEEKEEESTENPEFTMPRRVLAMHYIFEHLGVSGTEIDRKAKAKFVEFLTGNSYKNIYDSLQNPFTTKQKKFRYEDLQYIRTYFESLGLAGIVKDINEQLDKPR